MPVWLLDIDGVVNALDDPPPTGTWPADQWVRTSAKSALDLDWPLVVAAPVLDFLRKVTEQGRADIRWHSAWQHNAVNVGAALGLPDWPVEPCPEYALGKAAIAVPLTRRVSHWWKLPAAMRILERDGSLLWTDDDARYQLRKADTERWGDRALVISPLASGGLTPAHLRRIDAWLARQAAS
ncbi:hypothetical protein HDA40_000215 [Hamadaea flava]|uniref:Secreted protein n=1 Tax=Hamadaea flava TaxID=1742688 RepID=A0ABV8LYX1_9ACTN|nr:hypothetical protein [Hamadaea flava]MCP2321708.1 hypothetical protein [Hamadaea flava]